jgi:ubiquitin carboxyl-terminal hydrolase 4/11/15
MQIRILTAIDDDYKHELNASNPLGFHGNVAKAYAALLNSIYSTNSSFSPTQFKATIGKYGVGFSGYGQQDSQEFLLFLLDGLQEDLNRIKKKPYIEKPDSTDEMVHNPAALKAFADQNWDIYKARNDSVITDLFAGMYKSTVTCPVCDKVSIIFDPFNTLTLQLPIENNWSKEVYFFPLHSRPKRVDVDIDKNASMRALKEFVAKRVGCAPERLIMAESYKSKFYRMFDDVTVISEANIQNADIICLYEVESVPTNYDPKKQKRTTFYSSKEKEEIPDINSPAADRLLVPIFNRVVKSSNSRQRTFFGEPCYVVITREDVKTYDGVLRKVLGKVATMTTKNILDDDVLADPSITTPEDSDTVVMHDDDHSSDSNQIQTASVEGEDGFVDVSMKNTADSSIPKSNVMKSATHPVLQPGSFIPTSLQNLFQIKAVTSGEVIPLGLNQIDEHKTYTSVLERASRQLPHRPAKDNRFAGMANGLPTLNSSDEDTDDVLQNDRTPVDDESEGSSIEHDERASGSRSDASDDLQSFSSIMQNAQPSSRGNSKQKTYSRKGKKDTMADPTPDEIPSLIRPGEGILLDWEWDSYDALFEGAEDDDEEFRGSPTWKKVDLHNDEELIKKRATRQTRRRNGITLDDCLNEFGKEETLTENNAWYCPKCKEHRQAQKKFELWRTPDILVMHLKRFSSNRNFRDKLDLPVVFPLEGLDLQDRVLSQEEGKTLIYDLFAVDNHYGGLGGGHYTAYAQSFFNKEWYEYNGRKFLIDRL